MVCEGKTPRKNCSLPAPRGDYPPPPPPPFLPVPVFTRVCVPLRTGAHFSRRVATCPGWKAAARAMEGDLLSSFFSLSETSTHSVSGDVTLRNDHLWRRVGPQRAELSMSGRSVVSNTRCVTVSEDLHRESQIKHVWLINPGTGIYCPGDKKNTRWPESLHQRATDA